MADDRDEARARGVVMHWAQEWLVGAANKEKEGRWTGTFLNGAIPELQECIALVLRAVREEEREACAKIADEIAEMREAGAGDYPKGHRCRQIAVAIRRRSALKEE